MSREKQPVDIVVAEFNTDTAASEALQMLKSKLQLKDAAVIKSVNILWMSSS